MEFLTNVFTKFSEFSDKKYLSLKRFEPGISCVRDQDATKPNTVAYKGGLNG